MDTSTSQKRKKLTTGTPDSEKIEIDTAYFLSNGRLPGKINIPNEIWVKVITEFLWGVDPHFKYIDGLKTIEQIVIDGEWLNPHGTAELTSTDMTFFSDDQIDKKTRGFFISVLQHSSYGKGGGPVSYTNLVLAEKGKWIRWHVTRLGTSCSSKFYLLSDEEFCSLLDATKRSGYSIMDKLYLLLYSSRSRKEERLASIKKLEEEAQQICARAR